MINNLEKYNDVGLLVEIMHQLNNESKANYKIIGLRLYLNDNLIFEQLQRTLGILNYVPAEMYEFYLRNDTLNINYNGRMYYFNLLFLRDMGDVKLIVNHIKNSL